MSEGIKEILESYINHNEIEIILDRIKEIVDNEIIDYGEELSLSECKCLLNYITNLQKENENLLYEINGYLEEKERLKEKINKLKDYKQRNKKAIEWLERHIKMINGLAGNNDGLKGSIVLSDDIVVNSLLYILQGGDE